MLPKISPLAHAPLSKTEAPVFAGVCVSVCVRVRVRVCVCVPALAIKTLMVVLTWAGWTQAP